MRLNYEISEYNSMHLSQKALILEKMALFLDHNLSFGVIHTLFFYHRFFIEVVIENESNELIEIRAFDNDERLNKYLEKIHINDLL